MSKENTITISVPFSYEQSFLPTKRHRKERRTKMSSIATFSIRTIIDPSSFPIAFIVHDTASLYKDAKTYNDFTEDKYVGYVIVPREIRTFNGKLYSKVMVTHGAAVSTTPETATYISKRIESYERSTDSFYGYTERVTKDSILLSNNKEIRIASLQNIADQFVVFNGFIYEECSEPMYTVNTFGLGHNHGGTGFFIEDYYNPNISWRAYFNALNYNEAVKYGKEIAAKRGDTKSVDSIGKFGDEKIYIEVLIPEIVKRNPQLEHGEGDLFKNELEDICSNSSSSFEAGLLCLVKAQSLINKERT